jgi:ABC-type nitrate/sulfonate/bicarbonate transport system permease component
MRPALPEDTGMRRAPAAPIAVEVELTDKSARRLDEILRAWRRSLAAGQFDRVRYLCSPRALPYVSRAVKRMGGEWTVDVVALEGSGDLLTGIPS